MSVSRTVLAAVATWLAVVAVGSVLVWAVISRAGDVEPGSATEVPAASGGGATSSRPEPSDAPSDAPSDDAERRTWQGPGGYVSVQCRASVISLVAAQADAGFVVEVDERGPEQVKVDFEGQGEEGRETQVVAVCVTGVPEFDVASEE